MSVIVVGAGVVGLSIAWELSRRGQDVLVLDGGKQRSGGASWAGAGILPPAPNQHAVDPYDQLKSLSHQLHREWAVMLREQTGIDTGYRRCGGLYLSTTAGETATLIANTYWWDEHGIEHERWSNGEVQSRTPALEQFAQTSLKTAYFLPDECQLRNPWHLDALRAACLMDGVKIIEELVQDRVDITDERVRVYGEHQSYEASQLVVASGAWSRQFLESRGISNGIMPIRGQIILYRGDAQPLPMVVNEGHRYIVPREDGYVLVGSVEEEVGYVVETTEVAIASLRKWSESVLPCLSEFRVEKSWAGLRPGSFDGLPYLGRLPGAKNCFVASGHFRSGLHLSCGTAVVLADLMQGKPHAIDLEPFRVGRG